MKRFARILCAALFAAAPVFAAQRLDRDPAATPVYVVDANGNINGVVGNSTLSTANSTTANLANGAVFTGTSEEVKDYASIQVSVFSSHASATNGLSLQQSSDGTNWDITDAFTVSATTGIAIQVQPAARYFRLVYTNGSTLTTSLRIQTVLHAVAPRGSSQRPSDARSNENDFEEMLAYNMVFNGTTWDRARGTTANGLLVDMSRNPVLPLGTDRSVAVTTGGTAQQLAAANTARSGLKGQNTSAEVCWYNEIGGTAAVNGTGSFSVPAGGSFSVSTQRAISYLCPTTGSKVAATEW